MDWFDALTDDTPTYTPFTVAPFSLVDARKGPWKARKKWWLAKGIRGELGRDTALLPGTSTIGPATVYGVSAGSGERGEYTTSVFDPVLCEVLYNWFCPPGGHVLDPFAGGAVRGVVASVTGRTYTGVDLSQRQVVSNRNLATSLDTPGVRWEVGDSSEVQSLVDGPFDFLFSCPPYWNLEKYSDDPRDLSTLTYEGFLDKYREIISASAALLNDDAFACFVVGDVRERGSNGAYVGFVADTIKAFQEAGLPLYNDILYVYPDGSLPMRAGRSLRATRKISKTHQNVLVFLKGDARRAAARMGVTLPIRPGITGEEAP